MNLTPTLANTTTGGVIAHPALFQLIYVSAARGPFSKAELMALLERSRQKNARDGISGLLLYHDGDFMQLLEGPEGPVCAAYARIVQDPRHHLCNTLVRGPVEKRTFSEWSMGFRDLALADGEPNPSYSGFLNPGAHRRPLPTEPSRALKLLQVFRSNLR